MSLKLSTGFRNGELDVDELRETSRILHLNFHHNKNQHRATVWWKWLSILRRSIDKLLGEVELGAALVFDRERNLAAIAARVAFIRDILVPRCCQAFGTVIADKAFAPLGLVLVALLARTDRLLGSAQHGKTSPPEAHSKEKENLPTNAERVTTTSEDITLAPGGRVLGEEERGPDGEEDEDVDMGESVSREREDGEVQAIEVIEQALDACGHSSSNDASKDALCPPSDVQNTGSALPGDTLTRASTSLETEGQNPSRGQNRAERKRGRKKTTAASGLDELFKGII
ncbi:MAG: hypothetical protein M1829_004512 [Trizodia sp. TS-e1964]|nr:MAG: hypothetical protein M1829_004512 [Trizodia sp. TS-e1964]